jgi:hypothetical protein
MYAHLSVLASIVGVTLLCRFAEHLSHKVRSGGRRSLVILGLIGDPTVVDTAKEFAYHLVTTVLIHH